MTRKVSPVGRGSAPVIPPTQKGGHTYPAPPRFTAAPAKHAPPPVQWQRTPSGRSSPPSASGRAGAVTAPAVQPASYKPVQLAKAPAPGSPAAMGQRMLGSGGVTGRGITGGRAPPLPPPPRGKVMSVQRTALPSAVVADQKSALAVTSDDKSTVVATDEDKLVDAMAKLTVTWGTASYPKMPPALGKKRPFYSWLFLDGPVPTEMNCWEAVLYAAVAAGVKDKPYLKKAVTAKGSAVQLVVSILANPSGQYKLKANEKLLDIPNSVAIPKGHVILFAEDGQHVALSTGTLEPIKLPDAKTNSGKPTGHGLLELDKATTGIEKSTVEDTMERNSPYRRMVSWGPLPTL